jgi:hypothetical protein
MSGGSITKCGVCGKLKIYGQECAKCHGEVQWKPVGGIPELCENSDVHESHLYGPEDSNYLTACPGVKE